jgi:hypothetical protein
MAKTTKLPLWMRRRGDKLCEASVGFNYERRQIIRCTNLAVLMYYPKESKYQIGAPLCQTCYDKIKAADEQ